VWLTSKSARVQLTKSEVNVAQYAACVSAGACQTPAPVANERCEWGLAGRREYPINCVDWFAAEVFCKWAGGRLPTGKEWSAEASAGGTRSYPWGKDRPSCALAVMDDGGNGCGRGKSWPVCSKPAGNSISGLCDMAGNVFEWTAEENAGKQTLRGGAWNNNVPAYLQVDHRLMYRPTMRTELTGFRCARAIR
jgi:formylglycine-generating enzyme required for sulfatase activity